jgi:hypothetical protein
MPNTGKRLRPLLPFAYCVAALLVLLPLVEAAVAVAPAHWSMASWRFGAVGLFTRAVLTPLLGLMLVAGIALMAGHWRVLRGLAVVGAATVLLLMVVAVLFILDALEVRSQITADAHHTFDVAGMQALLRLAAAGFAMLLLAVGGWLAGRSPRKKKRPKIRARAPEIEEAPQEALAFDSIPRLRGWRVATGRSRARRRADEQRTPHDSPAVMP